MRYRVHSPVIVSSRVAVNSYVCTEYEVHSTVYVQSIRIKITRTPCWTSRAQGRGMKQSPGRPGTLCRRLGRICKCWYRDMAVSYSFRLVRHKNVLAGLEHVQSWPPESLKNRPLAKNPAELNQPIGN